MIRLGTHLIALSCAALIACGGGSSGVVPGLPGDGTDNTADPVARPTKDGEPTAPDPWEGRDDLIQTPSAKAPSAVALPKITRFKLPNGLQVIAVEDHTLPVVSMQLAVRSGDNQVSHDRVGLADFVNEMLTKGTRKRDASKIAEAIDFVGGSLSASARYEASFVNCEVLAKDIKTCLTLMPDVVMNPTFAEKEMDIVRKGLHSTVRQRKEDAGTLVRAHFSNFLFGDSHQRGAPLSARTIESIKRTDLVAWHKAHFVANNAILAVAGDINGVSLKRDLQKAFGRWRKGKVKSRKAVVPPKVEGIKIRLVDKPDQTQSHLRIGHFGISRTDPDFYDMTVFNYTLGGGAFSSRLIKVVRSEAGKTYSASSGFDRNKERGAFVATTFTRTPETVATVRLVMQEIAKMAESGPSDKEVEDAITNIAGSYSTRFESAADIAGSVLSAELYGYDEAYVRDYALQIGKVNRATATRAAKKRLDPKNLKIVIVGNAKEIEPQLRKAGWTYTKIGHLEPISKLEREAIAAELNRVDPKAEAAGKKILDQALKAKGGKAALTKLSSLEWEGEATLTIPQAPQPIPAKVIKRYVEPDKLRLDLEVAGGQMTLTTVLNGKSGWAKQGGRVIEFPSSEVEAGKSQIWRDQDFVLLRHLEKGVRVKKVDDHKIEGVAHHAVSVTNAAGKRSVTLYIDKKTNLLAGMSYTESGLKAEEWMSNYKKVKGVQFAHTRRTKSEQMDLATKVGKIGVNAKVDAKLFEKPAK
jgi:zinc protease